VSPDIHIGLIVPQEVGLYRYRDKRVLMVGWPGSFTIGLGQHYNTDEAWVGQKKEEYRYKARYPCMDR